MVKTLQGCIGHTPLVKYAINYTSLTITKHCYHVKIHKRPNEKSHRF